MFNSLIEKEEATVKVVVGSACKVIGTETVKVTERDEMVHALEVIQYVLEACYNLISIWVLDKEGCQIQVQQGGVTVNQGDRVILEGEKCEGLYQFEVKIQG